MEKRLEALNKKSDLAIFFLLGFIVVVSVVFFVDKTPYAYGVKFSSWSYSLDGENWKDYDNPLRMFYGSGTVYVRGVYESQTHAGKSFFEFGSINAVSAVRVNGVDLGFSSRAKQRSILDLSSVTKKGLNVVVVIIDNPSKGEVSFEYNEALVEVYLYTLFLVVLGWVIVVFSFKFSRDSWLLVLGLSLATLGFLILLLRYNIPVGVSGDWTYNRAVPIPSLNQIIMPLLIFSAFIIAS